LRFICKSVWDGILSTYVHTTQVEL
jgi:hypothetical protein